MQRGTKQKTSSKKKISQGVSEYWRDLKTYHKDYYDSLCERMKNSNKHTNKNINE